MKNALVEVLPPMPAPLLPSTPAIPLGTAAWGVPEQDGVRPYQMGDFMVGFDDQGRMMGVRDPAHAAMIAMTRSGKGTSVIIGNLLCWQGSVVVIDPKGENAQVTARSRGKGSAYSQGMGQTVRILDPFGEVKTASDDFADVRVRFNPLDLLSPDKEESVDTARRIIEGVVANNH